MKILPGFIKKRVGDVDIVVAVGEASTTFNALITLNSSGAFLWDKLEKGTTEEEMVAALLEKYEISQEIAARDVAKFIDKAKGAGVVEE